MKDFATYLNANSKQIETSMSKQPVQLPLTQLAVQLAVWTGSSQYAKKCFLNYTTW